MQIRVELYDASLQDSLVTIWERAVRATHHFLSEADIVFYRTVVRDEALQACSVSVAFTDQEQPAGFIGVSGKHIEMLFIDPLFHGQGVGTKLIQDHIDRKGLPVSVDVNEQNEGAVHFYKRLGFMQVGRSEQDGSGRPFPLLHLEKNMYGLMTT